MRDRGVSAYISLEPKTGYFRYYRRVPNELRHVIRKVQIKKTLKTKDFDEATRRASSLHEQFNVYLADIGSNDASNYTRTADEVRLRAERIAEAFGVRYVPASDIANLSKSEKFYRLSIARDHFGIAQSVLDAVLGLATIRTSDLSALSRLSDIWRLYQQHNAAGLTGMSPNQLAKHQVSRERAIRYAIDLLGDMELATITRPDVLRFRDWWTKKITDETLKAYSANRSFSDIKGMLTVIDDALRTDFHNVWEKVRIKETNATKLDKRRAYPKEWVQDVLLAAGAMSDLIEDARLVVYVMVETGMRLGEVCNLRPQDVRLDDDVPHVEIADRADRRQKTEHSIRRIPLVGVALWAMKRRPAGFPRYHDKADGASATINKALKRGGLFLSDQHTVYSLRHTFQDRLENAGASDRMQADLMGHECGRPTYGSGVELKRRQLFLETIKFDWPTRCQPDLFHT